MKPPDALYFTLLSTRTLLYFMLHRGNSTTIAYHNV